VICPRQPTRAYPATLATCWVTRRDRKHEQAVPRDLYDDASCSAILVISMASAGGKTAMTRALTKTRRDPSLAPSRAFRSSVSVPPCLPASFHSHHIILPFATPPGCLVDDLSRQSYLPPPAQHELLLHELVSTEHRGASRPKGLSRGLAASPAPAETSRDRSRLCAAQPRQPAAAAHRLQGGEGGN